MYWERIVEEVKNQKSPGFQCYFTHGRTDSEKVKSNKSSLDKRVYQRYSVGIFTFDGREKHIYFTRREAECMLELLKGKTNNQIGHALNLSPRTIEYYLKNMKFKLRCQTRAGLVEKVLTSEFMNHVDFL
jgi:DNA-binding CsgD family transcriptional regulator